VVIDDGGRREKERKKKKELNRGWGDVGRWTGVLYSPSRSTAEKSQVHCGCAGCVSLIEGT
jgi:hypothetical protein